MLARHGGDEFVVLLPATSEGEAEAALARLRFEEQRVSWSVGVCEWPAGEDLQSVLARADARLYEAKLAKPSRSRPGERARPAPRAQPSSAVGDPHTRTREDGRKSAPAGSPA